MSNLTPALGSVAAGVLGYVGKSSREREFALIYFWVERQRAFAHSSGGQECQGQACLHIYMANSFFDPGSQPGAKVNDLFTRIASRYDLLNDLQSFGLHRYWKRRVVEMAAPHPGARALDLCCGTGDIARGLARRGAAVVGLDFVERMLKVAEERHSTTRNSAAKIHFVLGDAQHLPFADNSFEIVTVGYGLRNLTSWENGLDEMRRVAKPGGRLVALDFGKPENDLGRGLYFGYLNLFVPWLGRVFCGNAAAYSYILESLKHYPAQHGVAGKMCEMGLANVRIINLLGGAMCINYGEKSG